MNLSRPLTPSRSADLPIRQAQFLILVARHSGVCVMRQSFDVRGRRLWPEDPEVLRQARAARIGLDLRLRARSRARLPRAPSGDLRGDGRARQPASPAAWRASRARTAHAAGRHPGEPGQRLDVVPRPRRSDYFSKSRNRDDDYRMGPATEANTSSFGPSRIACRSAPSVGHVFLVYLYADPLRDEFRRLLAAARGAP